MVKLNYIWKLNRQPFTVKNHVHSCYEIIYYYVANGTVEYYLNNNVENNESGNINYIDQKFLDFNKESFHFTNNTLIIISPHIVHNEIHTKEADLVDIGFELNGDMESFETAMISDGEMVFYPIVKRIEQEYKNKKIHYNEYIDVLIEQLLYEISRTKSSVRKSNSPMEFAKNYIKNNYATEIDLSSLAEQSGYGPERFRFLFKEEFGISPKEYIINRRIDSACSLLVNTDYSMTQISSSVGYDDIAQFSSIFKKKVGISPMKYRKEHKELIKSC